MEIFREFSFEAAHRLPRVPRGHKCERLHGHSFRVRIQVAGEVDAHSGWVQDFDALQQAFGPVHAALDHRYLNEVQGLDNPTSENIAIWIWQRLKPSLAGLCEVRVWETCSEGCVYRGPRANS